MLLRGNASADHDTQKQANYDEFTVFGKPSNEIGLQPHTTADCLTFDAPPSGGIMRQSSPRRSELQQEILNLERKLRTRPLSARPQPEPRLPTPQVPVARRATSARRPVTSVTAYRNVGLTPDYMLLPQATALLEHSRGGPKVEEQIMLGFMKSNQARLAPRPHWKMKRFEMIRGTGLLP